MTSIVKQEFDSNIFKVPYYRIVEFNLDKIYRDLSKLIKTSPIIIDAKIDSSNKEWDIYLQKIGFRKVCMQVELSKTPDLHKLLGEFCIKKQHILSDKVIKQHVDNFRYDRFSLDTRLDYKKRNILYFKWIKNSLESSIIYKVIFDNNFCSFKIKNNEIIIDLTSVLDHGQNIGSMLLETLDNYAFQKKINNIKVVTECENWGAYRFYIKNGFKVSKYMSCFHFVN